MQVSVLVVAGRDAGVAAALSGAGLLASRADSLAAAWAATGKGSAMFDLVVVDAALPDGDGMDYCAGLRLQGFQGPIILLGGAQSTEPSLIPILDSWLPTPVQPGEVLACVAGHVSRITTAR